MKKAYILCLILLFFNQFIFSQGIDNQNDSSSFPPSETTISKNKIIQLRNELIHALEDDDRGEAIKISKALMLIDSSKINVFRVEEKILLESYLFDYQMFNQHLIDIDILKKVYYQNGKKKINLDDGLLELLKTKMIHEIDFKNHLENISTFNVDSFFYDLGLKYMLFVEDGTLFKGDTSQSIREYLNKNASVFVKRFQDSKYSTFVKEEIYNNLVPDKVGWGIELFSGLTNHYGKMGNQFNGFPVLGIGLECYYQRFVFLAKYSTSIFATTKDSLFIENRVWQRKISNSFPEIGFGYKCINRKKLDVTPYATVSLMNVGQSVSYAGGMSESFAFSIFPLYSFGVNFDIKFKRPERTFNFITQKPTKPYEIYSILRIRPIVSFSLDYRFKGGSYALQVAWAYSRRKLNRVFLD